MTNNFVKAWVGALFSPLRIVVFSALTVFLAVTGPFGTYEHFSIISRLASWGAIAASAVTITFTLRTVLAHVWPACTSAVRAILSGIVLGLTVAPIIAAFGRHIYPVTQTAMPAMPLLMLFVFLVAVAVIISQTMIEKELANAMAPNRPPLLNRIGCERARKVLHLSVDDHYVHVLTDTGEKSVLLRFADALGELTGAEGLQVHRSHWVARDAIKDHRKDGKRMILTLTNGREVPVSQSYMADLMDTGWLD